MPTPPPASLKALGHAAKIARTRRCLSQEAAGHRCGLGAGYFSQLERGASNPSYLTLLKIAAGLRIPLEQLVAEANGLAA